MRRRPCSCQREGCRISRPLCARMRARTTKYESCSCPAYHYPHRRGSGRCDFHPDATRRQFEQFTGQLWDAETPAE